jgi:hypothetical protein
VTDLERGPHADEDPDIDSHKYSVKEFFFFAIFSHSFGVWKLTYDLMRIIKVLLFWKSLLIRFL